MNAEALVGMTLGTSTLRRLLGRGGMGAVFLADQASPPRQVAVKVLFPMTTLAPDMLLAFLERFRREAAAASSLQHPHIMPVYEYGEENGLPYLVMPYVEGGTLRDQMERERALPYSTIVHYLEQLAAALDFAHERGMVHRDVKPANILRSGQSHLLLSDFGLVKVLVEEPSTRMQLSNAGLPLGTPEFMAPEQVLGQPVDGRSDLYALGAILYQMVTGSVPFVGETPMQVAAQHLQSPPRSPSALRPDLPVAAEQVLLRALAKRPEERYARAQELAVAFRQALQAAGVSLQAAPAGTTPGTPPAGNTQTLGTLRNRRSLFDPVWREGAHAAESAPSTPSEAPSQPAPAASGPLGLGRRPGLLGAARLQASSSLLSSAAVPQTPFPENAAAGTPPLTPLAQNESLAAPGASTSAWKAPVAEAPSMANGFSTLPVSDLLSTPEQQSFSASPGGMSPGLSGAAGDGVAPQLAFPPTGTLPGLSGAAGDGVAPQLAFPPAGGVTRVLPLPGATGALSSGTTGALTAPSFVEAGARNNTAALTGALKLVQIPVAGQPGRYVTSMLPVLTESAPAETDAPRPLSRLSPATLLRDRMKLLALALTLLLVLSGSVVFLLLHAHSTPSQSARGPQTASTFSPTVQASPTATVILEDALNQNVHNWPFATGGSRLFVFKNGAYHITDNDDTNMAVAILPDAPAPLLSDTLSYTLTMQEIKGDDTSINNQFGIIIRYNQQTKGGKVVTQFYAFEVRNTSGGEYQFWKFNSSASNNNNWTKIWSKGFGKEYHQGHGAKAVNTLKVVADGKNFTFYMNGKKVGTAKDGSIATGSLGLLVNLKGTEVAFSNLLVTTP